MDLTQLTIKKASNLLKNKEIKAVELVQQHVDKAKASNLNAFTEITAELAMNSAKKADEKILTGQTSLLEGIPIGVKNLFCTKGFESTACSNILEGFIPNYESTVTANLFKAGGIMLGKTNMDEFAMGSSNENSCKGPVLNPWGLEDGKKLVPGGSSGGSSAAVAAKLSMGALRSDTGGSIRQPAAFTGIVGIKPTYGRCSRWGMIAFASSLDQAGVFARTVEDSAIMLEAICGYDLKDSTSANISVPKFSDSTGQSIKGLRIGIPKEYRIEGTNEEILKAWDKGIEWLRDAGAEIVDISLPHTKYALPTYYIIAPAEASSNLARYDGVRYGKREMPEKGGINDMYEMTRGKGFGREVKRRLMIGTYALSAGYYDAYYIKAQKVRRLILNDFKDAFLKVDAILTPTAPSTAFSVGENVKDPITMYLNDVFTVPASLAGLPAISVPSKIASDGLPLGLHIIGNSFQEETVIKVADIIEKSANFKLL